MASELSVLMEPTAWSQTLSASPILDTPIKGLVPAHVRRWKHITPDIEQPALDHHFVSIHLGGAKRLHRSGDGHSRSQDVVSCAYSVIPAGSAFSWTTEGPIDFAHFYFAPSTLDHVIAEAFDRDPARISFGDALGEDDPLTGSIALALIDELSGDDTNRAYLDDLMHLLLCRMLRLHANVHDITDRARHALAPFRLRRAFEFIEENIAAPIGVAEMAAATGVSPYHFSRAFRQTTGKPPYAYLLDRRVAKAKALLADSTAPLTIIARQCGFTSLSQFSRMIRRETGVTPTRYRDQF